MVIVENGFKGEIRLGRGGGIGIIFVFVVRDDVFFLVFGLGCWFRSVMVLFVVNKWFIVVI